MERSSKGRKQQYDGLSRDERKKQKYSNLPYINSFQKLIPATHFQDFICNCPLKCNANISLDARRNECKKFYDTESYIQQSYYIAAKIQETPVKRKYESAKIQARAENQRNFLVIIFYLE